MSLLQIIWAKMKNFAIFLSIFTFAIAIASDNTLRNNELPPDITQILDQNYLRLVCRLQSIPILSDNLIDKIKIETNYPIMKPENWPFINLRVMIEQNIKINQIEKKHANFHFGQLYLLLLSTTTLHHLYITNK